MQTPTMFLTLAVVLVLVSGGVLIAGSVGVVKLWHVLALAAISATLILMSIRQVVEYGRLIFWVGILVGLLSVVRSYQYQAIMAQAAQEQSDREWEERWAEEERADEEARRRGVEPDGF